LDIAEQDHQMALEKSEDCINEAEAARDAGRLCDEAQCRRESQKWIDKAVALAEDIEQLRNAAILRRRDIEQE
jgi:hypothetical protein